MRLCRTLFKVFVLGCWSECQTNCIRFSISKSIWTNTHAENIKALKASDMQSVPGVNKYWYNNFHFDVNSFFALFLEIQHFDGEKFQKKDTKIIGIHYCLDFVFADVYHKAVCNGVHSNVVQWVDGCKTQFVYNLVHKSKCYCCKKVIIISMT